MNKKLHLVPLIFILALLVSGPATAQTDSPIETSISVDPREFTVGDPIQLQLVVNHPAESHVIFPELESEWGSFIVHSQSPPESVTNEDGSKTTTQMIDARLFAPGDYATLPLPITIAGADGQLTDATIDPVSVSIASVLVEGDESLRDIKPQAETPYLYLLPWIVGAVIAAVIALFITWYIRRKRSAIVVAQADLRLPHEVALDRLARIENLDLPNEGRFKEHYTMVSDCIRVYVERAFHIAVMERTTSEIQHSIRKTAISPPIAQQFLSLLDESDLVKFSKFTPDVREAQQALQVGRAIVAQTMSVNHPDSPPSSAGPSEGAAVSNPNPNPSVNGNYQQTEVRA